MSEANDLLKELRGESHKPQEAAAANAQGEGWGGRGGVLCVVCGWICFVTPPAAGWVLVSVEGYMNENAAGLASSRHSGGGIKKFPS